jgi:ribosome-associated protein
MDDVSVTGPLPLGAFLKLAGAVGTGGHAKVVIQSGDVTVNGEVETKRGRTLRPGDVVGVGGREYRVWSSPV